MIHSEQIKQVLNKLKKISKLDLNYQSSYNCKRYHDESFCFLQDQSTHCGQISDRSVQNFRRESSRKKIKKSRGVNHNTFIAVQREMQCMQTFEKRTRST